MNNVRGHLGGLGVGTLYTMTLLLREAHFHLKPVTASHTQTSILTVTESPQCRPECPVNLRYLNT